MLLDSSVRGDTLSVAHEGFSLQLTISVQDDTAVEFLVESERTYNRPEDTAYLNLPLVVRTGETISTGEGNSYTLSAEPVVLETSVAGGIVAYKNWRVSMPEQSKFEWPVYTYSPYGSVRVPENLHNALAVLSIKLDEKEESKVIRFSVE
jgi:hypothetical protein